MQSHSYAEKGIVVCSYQMFYTQGVPVRLQKIKLQVNIDIRQKTQCRLEQVVLTLCAHWPRHCYPHSGRLKHTIFWVIAEGDFFRRNTVYLKAEYIRGRYPVR